MSTLFQKIWDRHVVAGATGEPQLLYIDAHLIHEVTSPQAFDGLRRAGRPLRRPDLTTATMDHDTPTTKAERACIADPLAKAQLEALVENCEEFGVELFDMDSSHNAIVHMMGPEQGITQPGKTIVCGDSHTATHGAFGAIAFGIGTSEVEHVFATQCIWQEPPKTLGIELSGTLPEGVFAKDVVLALIARYGNDFGEGYALEFFGETVETMTMDERMTLCNMAIEMGAKYGLVAPDDTTFAYVKGRRYAPQGEHWEAAVADWRRLKTDSVSDFDKVLRLSVKDLSPHFTWGIHLTDVVAVHESLPPVRTENDRKAYEYMDLAPGMQATDIPIQYVFIGSCTNGRLSDLAQAASVLRGRTLAPGVRGIVVPGSAAVKRQCEENGWDQIFLEAGLEWREAGCSGCLAMNPDKVPPYTHAASTTNRNFIGRQGPNARTHLMSPAMAAAAGVAGRIVDVRTFEKEGGQ